MLWRRKDQDLEGEHQLLEGRELWKVWGQSSLAPWAGAGTAGLSLASARTVSILDKRARDTCSHKCLLFSSLSGCSDLRATCSLCLSWNLHFWVSWRQTSDEVHGFESQNVTLKCSCASLGDWFKQPKSSKHSHVAVLRHSHLQENNRNDWNDQQWGNG